MKTLQDEFSLTRADIANYQTKGYVVLRKFFSADVVQNLRASSSGRLSTPTDPYQRGFDKLAYDTCVGDQGVYALLRDARFRSVMAQLTGRSLFFTQGASFSLKQKVSTGLSWHIESQSFGYQRAHDEAATLWTPLDPIRRGGQRGGMRYVPRSVVCGKFMYESVAPAMFRHVQARIAQDGLPFEEYLALRDGPLNAGAMREMLEHHAEEHDFALGDALLFDKYVLHRSVGLEAGPLDTRQAFAFRFIAADSRYDRQRALDLEIPRRHYGYAGPTSFHLDVADRDGAVIVDSPLFDEDRAIRHLGVTACRTPTRLAHPRTISTQESP